MILKKVEELKVLLKHKQQLQDQLDLLNKQIDSLTLLLSKKPINGRIKIGQVCTQDFKQISWPHAIKVVKGQVIDPNMEFKLIWHSGRWIALADGFGGKVGGLGPLFIYNIEGIEIIKTSK